MILNEREKTYFLELKKLRTYTDNLSQLISEKGYKKNDNLNSHTISWFLQKLSIVKQTSIIFSSKVVRRAHKVL